MLATALQSTRPDRLPIGVSQQAVQAYSPGSGVNSSCGRLTPRRA